MRVVTDLRMPTGDQVRSGLGLDAQRATLADAGDRDGWEIVAERADEGVSGRVHWSDREALAAAVHLVDVGDADAVAIARLGRLARRTEDALEWGLRNSGTAVSGENDHLVVEPCKEAGQP